MFDLLLSNYKVKTKQKLPPSSFAFEFVQFKSGCLVAAPKNACLAGQQMPHPQINNDQADGEKAAAKQGPAAA